MQTPHCCETSEIDPIVCDRKNLRKLPALRADVHLPTAVTTSFLYPASRRRWLHIPRFRPKERKLAHSAAPPFPTETAALGFGENPVFVRNLRSKRGEIRPQFCGGVYPYLDGKAAHRRSRGETRGSFMRSARCSAGCIRCPVFQLSCALCTVRRSVPALPYGVGGEAPRRSGSAEWCT